MSNLSTRNFTKCEASHGGKIGAKCIWWLITGVISMIWKFQELLLWLLLYFTFINKWLVYNFKMKIFSSTWVQGFCILSLRFAPNSICYFYSFLGEKVSKHFKNHPDRSLISAMNNWETCFPLHRKDQESSRGKIKFVNHSWTSFFFATDF